LNPAFEKIISPVILIFPNNTKKKYNNGQEVSTDEFNRRYVVESLNAVGDCIEVRLVEQERLSAGYGGYLIVITAINDRSKSPKNGTF
jgi:hypothetical protein